MGMFKQVSTNTLFQVFGRLVTSGTSFVATIAIARAFGVSAYGDLAKITSFVGLFYILPDFGLNAIYLQLTSKKEKFTELLSLRMLLGIIGIIVISSAVWFLPYSVSSGYSPLVKTGILIFSLTLFTEGIANSSAAIFQKKLSYSLATVANVVGSIVFLLGVGVSILFSFSILGIIVSYIVSGIIKALLGVLLSGEKVANGTIDMSFFRPLLLQTLPITAMLVINLLYFRVDMFLLAILKPTQDVAVYDLAYRFFDFLIALPLFLSNSLYPHLLAWGKNYRIVIRKLILSLVVFFAIGCVVSMPVIFFSPLLRLIKPEFIHSSFALTLLTFSLPIFFATSILQWTLIAQKKQKFLLWVYVLSLVVNIVLNLVFIPQYSYVASAIITGVSEGFVLVSLLAYSLVVLPKSSL